MSLKKLSDGICDVSTLFRIEKGKHQPQLDTLILLSSKLRIPVQYLVEHVDHEVIIYINQVKQLCRKHVNNEDYVALNNILYEIDDKVENNLHLRFYLIEFFEFKVWMKAIYTHMHQKDNLKAKTMLYEIKPKYTDLLTETEIGILHSLGIIYLEENNQKVALELFETCMKAINDLPLLEDKMLYIRVGYSFALINFYFQNYSKVIEICNILNRFLDLHKLIYLGGRINHLLGIANEKENNLIEAEKHMIKASQIFLAESKQYYYLKALRALAEIQLKAGKVNSGVITLKKVESQICNLDNPCDLYKLIESTKDNYL